VPHTPGVLRQAGGVQPGRAGGGAPPPAPARRTTRRSNASTATPLRATRPTSRATPTKSATRKCCGTRAAG
jgi:hypothetical protein